MTFRTIEPDFFFDDILKTFVKLIQDNLNITVRISNPSTDVEFKLPCVIIEEVGKSTFSLNRNKGDFNEWNSDNNYEKRLYGYTYNSMFQFNIHTTTIRDNNKYKNKLISIFKPQSIFNTTLIPIKHFNNNNIEETDLKIKFDFEKDVEISKLPSFDPNQHLSSVSIDFRIDYVSEISKDKLKSFKTSTNIIK